MIGQTISHYKILEKLGEGGMGVVYKAEDTKLDRLVALKFLPHHLTSNETEKSRLLQEARAAAALNHPNVCSVIDIQESNGTQFIVMEYVDGVTLRRKAPVAKVDDAIRYAIQIGEALQAAHAKGIVHRDVKSENVMVTTDGHVKVMDFGLAKLKGSLKVTRTSSTVGTLAYMAPEQIQGAAVDARSDIFSFGVVLFEMLTGKLPFRGEHEAAIMYSIVNEDPQPIEQFSKNVPSGLTLIVTRALEKNPDLRYQSMQDVVNDLALLQSSGSVPLRRNQHDSKKSFLGFSKLLRSDILIPFFVILGAVVAGVLIMGRGDTTIDSIAVLPFANVGDNKDLEYMSDGITESLINSLSEVASLRVLPRSTVFQFKGQGGQAEKIGKELGVKAVLTGRIVLRGANLNVQVDLIDVQKQAQLWGEQYSRNMTDIIVVQEEIAKQISEKLRLRLTGEEQQKLTKRYTENVEAYQLYLKGRYYWAKRTAENLHKAVAYFNESIQSDPGYALAYSGLADAYIILGVYGEQLPAEAFPRAKAAARKALEIDPALAEAHASLGDISIHFDWDWNAARENLRKAIDLDPGYATAHHWNSEYLTIMGRHDEAIAETKKAAELDPLSLIINTFVGWNYYCARKNDSAMVAFNKALEIDQGFPWAHLYLGWSYLQMQRWDEAIHQLILASQSYENPLMLASLGRAYALAGRTREAQHVLDTLTNLSKRRYVSAYNFALVNLGLGQKNRTFDWLEKAYQERASVLFHVKVDPSWDPLRDDPRFRALLKKMDLEK